MSSPIAHIVSTSNASDLGLHALADLSAAAEGVDYRVIGGHMVHLLTHVYPTAGVLARVTADADAGVEKLTAAGLGLHDALLAQGYSGQKGNRYVKPAPGDVDEELAVDVLVPRTGDETRAELGGRGFDAVPGLSLALNVEPVWVQVSAQIQDGQMLDFAVPVPDVECALVLKALAWHSRLAGKDVSDIATLLEIAHEHRESLDSGWKLDLPRKGQRGDAAKALHSLAEKLGKGTVVALPHNPARLVALIQRHVYRA